MVLKGIFTLGFPIIVAALQTTTEGFAQSYDTRHSWAARWFGFAQSYDTRHSWAARWFVVEQNYDTMHSWVARWFGSSYLDKTDSQSLYQKLVIPNFENVGGKLVWSDYEARSLMDIIRNRCGKQIIPKFKNAGRKFILSDVESWIEMDNRYRYVDHLQTEKGKQTITYLQNAGSKFIWLNIESWIEMDNTYRYVVDHPEKARFTHVKVKMQNAEWKFILANVKSSWSVFRSDNESRYYGLDDKDYQMLISKILEASNLKYQPSGYHSEETDIYNRDIQLNGKQTIPKFDNAGWKLIWSDVESWIETDNIYRYVFLAKEDYQMLMLNIRHKQQWNQILTESNMKCQTSCFCSEETDIYNRVIIFNELKIQRSMESLHGIESTALLATFMLAAFAIRIVSEEELMKDTLTHSQIVKITTKEVRQNLPRRAEEEAFRQCGFCINHNQAIAYCNTCKLNICMPCKNTHKKVWTYINHTVCPFDEM